MLPALLPDEGIAWYVGAPGTGKTTLALEHAGELSRATGWPVLVLDSTRARQFAGYPHAANVDAAIARLYGQARGHAVYSPEDVADVEALCRALRAGGRVVLLLDESAFWLSSQAGRGGELLRLMRGWRHADVRVLLTTQHLSGDVPQEAWACAPRVYVFRQASPAAWALLEKRFQLAPELVRELRVGEFVEYPSRARVYVHARASEKPDATRTARERNEQLSLEQRAGDAAAVARAASTPASGSTSTSSSSSSSATVSSSPRSDVASSDDAA